MVRGFSDCRPLHKMHLCRDDKEPKNRDGISKRQKLGIVLFVFYNLEGEIYTYGQK